PSCQVDELDALFGLDDEGFAVNRKAAGRRRCHLLHRFLAYGHGRTLAHSVLSVLGSDLPRPAFGHERSMLRENNTLRQPCYTPPVRRNAGRTDNRRLPRWPSEV